MTKNHTFHIPVMGIGFTIDTPLRVAHFGIDSVISLVDDMLIERMRKLHSQKNKLPYEEITVKQPDYRAKRITSYLNMINTLVENKFDELKNATVEKANDLKSYLEMLPNSAQLKQEFLQLNTAPQSLAALKTWLSDKLTLGSIDVNIMTKVDKDNFVRNEKLPVEFNDAHAALRGFAESNLQSSMVLSAGMNPRLYSYIEQFEDFYPTADGAFKKKIILKVSDFRSALIQGKFLAKKGIWISEYRVESGLNCGGHAFATDGFLMGPILAEFRDRKEELIDELQSILSAALVQKEKTVPTEKLTVKITAQGGVGTEEEHNFLRNHYRVDSVGWGTPFLLVPEAVNVDESTLQKLTSTREKDLFLSNISPLGVPFNSLRGNTKDVEKLARINRGKPGSPCPKRFVALSKEYNEKGMCTASREFQSRKIKELETQNLSAEAHQLAYHKIVEKSCTCVGLGTTALLVNKMETKIEGTGVSICPGPNMAYFSKIMKLSEITDHIYGRSNVISRTDRPNMFVKELFVYLDYFAEKLEETKWEMTAKQEKYLNKFASNLSEGIAYYFDLFEHEYAYDAQKVQILKDLENGKKRLAIIQQDLFALTIPT